MTTAQETTPPPPPLPPPSSSADQTAPNRMPGNGHHQSGKSEEPPATERCAHPRKRKAAAAPPSTNTVSPDTAAPNANGKPASPPAISHADAVDEVLSEIEDLLRAARDAQSLGRLSHASGFLCLAHARLIGLGRRLDNSHSAGDAARLVGDLADRLARSAQELLYRRRGKGMQHEADVAKRQERSRKRREAYRRGAMTGPGSNGIGTELDQKSVREGETNSKCPSSAGADAGAISGLSSAALNAEAMAPPRTVLNCPHLDARRLVMIGMGEKEWSAVESAPTDV